MTVYCSFMYISIRGVVWVTGWGVLPVGHSVSITTVVCAVQWLEDLGLGHLKPEMATQNIDR